MTDPSRGGTGASPSRAGLPSPTRCSPSWSHRCQPGGLGTSAAAPGRNSLWLAARGWHVTALDASAVALARAHQRAATLGVQLASVQADARRWASPPSSFDLLVIANLHPGADQLTGLLTRAAQALVSGGHLFVVGHDLSKPRPPRATRPRQAAHRRTSRRRHAHARES